MSGRVLSPVQYDEILSVLEGCSEYFEQRADAEYFTDSAGPVGNEESHMLAEVGYALRELRLAEQAVTALNAMMDAWFDYHDANSLTQPVTGAAGNAFDQALAAREKLEAFIAKARGDQ